MTDPVPPPGAKKKAAPKEPKAHEPTHASPKPAKAAKETHAPAKPAAHVKEDVEPSPAAPSHHSPAPAVKPVVDAPHAAPTSALPKAAAPAVSAPAAAKPAPSPPAAAPKPTAAAATPTVHATGDHAALAGAFQGTSFAVLEDGAGVTTVAGDDLFSAAAWAKENGYRILSNLSAYDRGDHFGVLYCFVKTAATPAEFGELRLRVVMPKAAGEPSCSSLEDLFPAAGWHEREMFDMYGVRFEGNSDLRRMFLPDGWTGHPMRKDYKEPEQFVALREGEDVVVKTNEEGSW